VIAEALRAALDSVKKLSGLIPVLLRLPGSA
jgi:hypothetical protein